MARLNELYNKEMVPQLMKDFNYRNVMEVPKLEKIVVNMGLGEAIQNVKILDSAVDEMAVITGQKPIITKAKKSIAGFKLRQGMPIGCAVTLRKDKMYEFLDRLVNVSLPRVRDFKGISGKAFDGKGNYSLGVKEQLIFPEINYDKIDKIKGLNITIVPSSIEIELACYAMNLNVCHLIPYHIDWCFDGADEVDPLGRLIKGRGGALYRERLVFTAARKRIVVADSSKTVDRLGSKFPVPVEVEPTWVRSVYARMGQLNHVSKVVLRMGVAKDGPVITESGRLLMDVTMTKIEEADEESLLSIPGVCYTGIFTGFDFERIAE